MRLARVFGVMQVERAGGMIGLGIDFGSTVSAAAVIREDEPTLIPSAERANFGGKSFPSCVALTFDERILVGEPARLQAADNPGGTTSEIKARLGLKELVMLRGRGFSPERLAGFVLEKIRRDAEAFLGTPLHRATVGVPAKFNASQRDALRAAAGIAGFSTTALVEEPIAAALAHRLDRHEGGRPVQVLVVDFGSSGLDVARVEFAGEAPRCTAIAHRTDLSVAALDAVVFAGLAGKFALASGTTVDRDPVAESRLRRTAELARIELGAGRIDRIELGVLAEFDGCLQEVAVVFTRAELGRLMQPVLQRCLAAIREALSEAAIAPRTLDHLVLVGGVMRMPEIRALVEHAVGKAAETAVDPCAAVAIGAARCAYGGGESRASALLDAPPHGGR